MNTQDFDLDTYSGRLCYAMEVTGHQNQAKLARDTGVSQQTIGYLRKHGKGSAHTTSLAKVMGIRAEWLESYSGEMFPEAVQPGPAFPPLTRSSADGSEITQQQIEIRMRKVPVVGDAQMGDGGHFYHQEGLSEHGQGYVLFPTADTDAYALRSVGYSNYPRYMPGEFVIVSPRVDVIPGAEVFVKCEDGRVMVKIFNYEKENYVHLDSFRPGEPQIIIPSRDIVTMHRVTGRADKELYILS